MSHEMPSSKAKESLKKSSIGAVAGAAMIGAVACAPDVADANKEHQDPLEDPNATEQIKNNPISQKEHVLHLRKMADERHERDARIIEKKNNIATEIAERMGMKGALKNLPPGTDLVDHCTWIGNIPLTILDRSTASVLTEDESSLAGSLKESKRLMSGEMSSTEEAAYYKALDAIGSHTDTSTHGTEMNIDEEAQNYGVFDNQQSEEDPKNEKAPRKKSSPHIESGVNSVL